MKTQLEKAVGFKELHDRNYCFVIPNPWDVGSVKIIAHHGFEALATTSAGLAFSLGKRDAEGQLSINEVLENARQIVASTDLPVSADLENCYSNQPGDVFKTIQGAAEAGLVGGSIEDTTLNNDSPIRDLELAVEFVMAAVEAKNSLPFPFILTARAENFSYGRPDLNDTIRRLQAYQEAGADVLYAPGLARKEDITDVITSVDRPVNVVMGLQGTMLSLSELSEIGVRRVSLGSSLSRAAFGGLIDAIAEIKEKGTFTFADKAIPFGKLNSIF